MTRFFFGSLLISILASAAAAEAPSPDKLLPSDTLAVWTFPEYGKARAAWKDSTYGQLWNDPSLKAFREKFTAKLKSDLVEPVQREFGVSLSDYAGLAQGQVTLAVMPTAAGAKPEDGPGFLLVVDTRDKQDVLKTNLQTLKQKWIDTGKQVRPETIRNVEFTTLIFSSDDLSKALKNVFPEDSEDSEEPKKEPKKVEWLIGQSDSLLIVGTAAKDIEKVLIRQSGGGVPSLSENPAFSSRYGAMFRDVPAYGWLNLKAIFDLASKAAAKDQELEAPGALPKMDKMLGLLGLTSLETLAASLQNSPDGSFVNLHIHSPESGRKGIARILAHQSKDADPPSFVPADAIKFFRWRLDLQKAWATIETMISEISPQYASLLKTMLDLAGTQNNFDLRKQLIGNLGDDLISYEKAPRDLTEADLNSPPAIFLLGSPKAEELAASIKALVSFLPQQGTRVKEREFLGRKIYTLAMTSYDRDGKRQDRSFHYSASGGYVGFSYDVAMLEEYLRGSPAKALREMPALAQAAQKVGGMNSGLFIFENQAESGRVSFEAMKKQSGSLGSLLSDSALAGRLGVDGADDTFKNWFDFSLLPAWEKISKYFHISVTSGTLNTDGLTIKVFSPKPPQLK